MSKKGHCDTEQKANAVLKRMLNTPPPKKEKDKKERKPAK